MKVFIYSFFLFITFSGGALAFSCPDPRNPGQSVQIIETSSLPNIGWARVAADGRSEILWNPAMARQMGPDLAEFFRYHECAHIQDGYYNFEVNYEHSKFKESRADCLALLKMAADDNLSAERFENILSGLIDWQPNETHTHFSGRERSLVILDDCLAHNEIEYSN